MLMVAYDLKSYQVIGPAWLDTERYDVVAKVTPGATKESARTMWQKLLVERFQIALHRESKEFRVEELVIGKGGSKLKEVEDVEAPSGPPQMKNSELVGPGLVTRVFPDGPRAHAEAKAQAISQLTTMLTNQLRLPVLDKTGLTGKYDFTLDFVPSLAGASRPQVDPTGASTSDPGPDIGSAVQEQLGLKLIPGKATLDVIVIERAEKVPVEN